MKRLIIFTVLFALANALDVHALVIDDFTSPDMSQVSKQFEAAERYDSLSTAYYSGEYLGGVGDFSAERRLYQVHRRLASSNGIDFESTIDVKDGAATFSMNGFAATNMSSIFEIFYRFEQPYADFSQHSTLEVSLLQNTFDLSAATFYNNYSGFLRVLDHKYDSHTFYLGEVPVGQPTTYRFSLEDVDHLSVDLTQVSNIFFAVGGDFENSRWQIDDVDYPGGLMQFGSIELTGGPLDLPPPALVPLPAGVYLLAVGLGGLGLLKHKRR